MGGDSQNIRVNEPKKRTLVRRMCRGRGTLVPAIGFQKTTSSISPMNLHMSPTTHLSLLRGEIGNQRGCLMTSSARSRRARKIAASRSTAMQRIRNLIGFVERHTLNNICSTVAAHLIDAAIIGELSIMRGIMKHAEILEQIIA